MLAPGIADQLDDILGRAPRRLLDAVVACGKSQGGQGGPLLLAAKNDVLRQLAEAEGSAPTAETQRARIKQVNDAARLLGVQRYGGRTPFTLRSRKFAFELSFDADWEKARARQRAGVQAARSANEDSGILVEEIVDPLVFREGTGSELGQRRLVQIFLSHAHESEKIEAIVKEFAADLERKLRHLPYKYKELFDIRLWADHLSMKGNRHFEAQTDKECKRSEIAIFLLSDRWYDSAQCKRESIHFSADGPAGNRFLLIQSSGSFSHGDPRFANVPCFPMMWQPDVPNLLTVWNLSIAERDAFVNRVRDEICSALEEYLIPAKHARASNLEMRSQLLNRPQLNHYEIVVEQDNAEDPYLTPKEGGGDAVDGIDLLIRWACSSLAKNRVFALLGSFGSGKTTTSQLFVRRLIEKRDQECDEAAPVPIYLDLRRLNAIYDRHGEPPSLAALVRASLHPDIRDQIDADQLLNFLRTERCIVVFDGLDEVGTRIGVERLSALYRTMLELIPARAWLADRALKRVDWEECPTRILLTCRTHFFRDFAEQESILRDRDRMAGLQRVQGHDPIRTIYMAPFTPEQIQSYFRKSLGTKEGEAAFASIAALHDLAGLAKRPIMARYISEIAGDLIDDINAGRPVNVARIYGHLFRRALERDHDKRPILKFADRQMLLEHLAEQLYRNRRPSISADALDFWFDDYAENVAGIRSVLRSHIDARGLLQTELRNASLLVRSAEDAFSFVHTSFYEYFLARRLLNRLMRCDQEQEWPHVSDETCDFIYDLVEIDGCSRLFEQTVSTSVQGELAVELSSQLIIAKRRHLARLRKRRDALQKQDPINR